MESDLNLSTKLFQQLFDRYRDNPRILRALIDSASDRLDRDHEVLRAYIKLSPDGWAYERLAASYLKDGRIDQWQALLDEYLSRQPDDEQTASFRVGMANVFISRSAWEQALPYAESAAKKQSQAAMACLIRCYQGLGDDQQEGAWHERIVERYPSAANAREHYLWSRRTGLGDAQVLADRAFSRIGPEQEFAQLNEQMRFAAFYWLSRRVDDAIRCYESAASMAEDPGSPAFCRLCIALIDQEKGDQASRDEALAQLSTLRGPEARPFQNLKSWWNNGLAAKNLDPDGAQQLVADAPRERKPAMNFLVGYALLLNQQTQDAVPFLQTAATLGQGAGAPSRALAAAALRDRGLVPGRLAEPSE
jgi:tetratricopeptide (TPR) repeat protein